MCLVSACRNKPAPRSVGVPRRPAGQAPILQFGTGWGILLAKPVGIGGVVSDSETGTGENGFLGEA